MQVKDVANFLNNLTFNAHLLIEFMDEDGAFIGDIYCRRFGGVNISGELYRNWRKPVSCLDVSAWNGCTIVRFIILKGECKYEDYC